MTKTILLIILFMQLGFAQTKTYLTTEVNTLKSKNTMSLSMADVVVDSLPNAFAFTDITNATRSTLYTSNAVTLAGFDSAYAYAGGAEYTVYNIGDIPPYTYITGYTKVFPDDIIRVKQTSSSSYSTATNVILTVGGRSDTYTITTKSAPALSGGSKVLKVNGGILKDSTGKVIKTQ